MSRKGFISVQHHGVDSKRQATSLRLTAEDASATLPSDEAGQKRAVLLPLGDKLIVEMLGDNDAVGYFELPMKKLYDYPLQKHLITVNCPTKEVDDGKVSSELFGVVKLELIYHPDKTAKLDLTVKRLEVEGDKDEVERELYIECRVGDVASQTTLRKKKGNREYEWNEVLPFTLEAIPGRIDFVVKDKDMVNDEVLGSIKVDPHAEGLLEEGEKEWSSSVGEEGREMRLWLRGEFRVQG